MMLKIIISLISLTLTGLIWGLREYYHKNPKVFDTLWKVKPISFFGSQSWKLKYKDYDKGDTSPAFPLAKTFPINDFWHSSKYVFGLLLITGSILLSQSNLPFGIPGKNWIYVITAMVVQALGAWLSFNLLDRQIKKHEKNKS